MDGIQLHETSRLTQPNNEGNIREDSQQSQNQIPNQNSLDSVAQHGSVLIALQELRPQLMSGIYGYCLGAAVAALMDHSDGVTIGAGVVLSSIAGLYALTVLKSTPRTQTRIDRAYVTRHVCLFLVCAASGVITTSHNYCEKRH